MSSAENGFMLPPKQTDESKIDVSPLGQKSSASEFAKEYINSLDSLRNSGETKSPGNFSGPAENRQAEFKSLLPQQSLQPDLRSLSVPDLSIVEGGLHKTIAERNKGEGPVVDTRQPQPHNVTASKPEQPWERESTTNFDTGRAASGNHEGDGGVHTAVRGDHAWTIDHGRTSDQKQGENHKE